MIISAPLSFFLLKHTTKVFVKGLEQKYGIIQRIIPYINAIYSETPFFCSDGFPVMEKNLCQGTNIGSAGGYDRIPVGIFRFQNLGSDNPHRPGGVNADFHLVAADFQNVNGQIVADE
jgi:hypothetical protein